MKNLISVMLIIATMFSCDKHKANEANESLATETGDGELCFGSALKQDTILLNAKTDGALVTGSLTYNLFEKDRNSGTISGKLSGDTLLADYSFMSEGRESVRQVVFLKKDTLLLEGYGNMKELEGKFVFENLKEVKFGNGIVLQKTACQ